MVQVLRQVWSSSVFKLASSMDCGEHGFNMGPRDHQFQLYGLLSLYTYDYILKICWTTLRYLPTALQP